MLARMLEDSSLASRQQTLFGDDGFEESLLARFRTLLRTADMGILDLRVSKEESDRSSYRSTRTLIQLKHQAEFDDAWLPLEEESRGTQTLFRLTLPSLQTIDSGGVLLVDELEASLPPDGSRDRPPVQRSHCEPRNAQLIFTTHDTNLLGTTLGEPALRRDQVWLTEKDKEGATVLYPLTDYKPRKAENMERGYLQGRYGASRSWVDSTWPAEWPNRSRSEPACPPLAGITSADPVADHRSVIPGPLSSSFAKEHEASPNTSAASRERVATPGSGPISPTSTEFPSPS